jgi:hypothetical protein
LLFFTGFTSFGIKAQFLVQVCLSFNIFHPFVSLPYRSIFVCSCDVTSSSYFEILFYYSQKLVADPEKKKKKKKNEKRDRLVEEERKKKKKYYSVLPNFQNYHIPSNSNMKKIPYSLCSNMKFLH